MSEKLQDQFDNLSIKDTLVDMTVETKDDVKNEIDLKLMNPSSNNSELGSPKPSRELKSLLALSKEANLDTNIAYKRKSVEVLAKVTEKSELVKNLNATETMSNSPKSIIRVDYIKHDVDGTDIQETKDGYNNKSSMNSPETLHNTVMPVENNASNETCNRNIFSNEVIVINNERKDPFCWICHHEKSTIFCEACPRSFHHKCLKQNTAETNRWMCPICIGMLKAESVKQRSPTLQNLPLEHFCGLIKFALKRMMQVEGHEPFTHPVNEVEFPEYQKYVAQPQDLNCLEKNVKNNVYGSTLAFEADAQWILHNSIIFNSYQSKFTTIAKSMMKTCKQEMAEIENCSNCYLNANTKKTWFVEVCPKPHIVVWAKLKGFPYWPAKVMRSNSAGLIDVRFFGEHDKAWVPYKDCFLYSVQDPNSNKQKRNDIIESIKELNVYIENLKRVYGEFCYAPYRTVFNLEEEFKQLKMMLPSYDPEKKVKPGMGCRKSSRRNSKRNLEALEKDSDESFVKADDDLTEDTKLNHQPDDSTIDNSPGQTSNGHMWGGFVNTSGDMKAAPKTYAGRKRMSSENLNESPRKLLWHSVLSSSNQSDTEPSEICSHITKEEASTLTNKDSPKPAELTKSSIADLLFKKLSNIIEKESEKDQIVCDTDLLLDTVNNKIDSLFEEYPELTHNTDKVNIPSDVLATIFCEPGEANSSFEDSETHDDMGDLSSAPNASCKHTEPIMIDAVVEQTIRKSPNTLPTTPNAIKDASSVFPNNSCLPEETVAVDEVMEVNIVEKPCVLPTAPHNTKEKITLVEDLEVDDTNNSVLPNSICELKETIAADKIVEMHITESPCAPTTPHKTKETITIVEDLKSDDVDCSSVPSTTCKPTKTFVLDEVTEPNVVESTVALLATPHETKEIVAAVEDLDEIVSSKPKEAVVKDEIIELDMESSTELSTKTNIPIVEDLAVDNIESSCKPKETILIDEVTETTSASTIPHKTKDGGRVEVIEVDVTEDPELLNQMEFESPMNIQDIVQAGGNTIVSISTIESVIDAVAKNVENPCKKDKVQPTFINSTKSINKNKITPSSTDKYINPLSFVEVAENILTEEKDNSEENKTEDALKVITQSNGSDLRSKSNLEPEKSNKRRRSSDIIETINTDEPVKKKSLRLINIDDIKIKPLVSRSLTSFTNSQLSLSNNLQSIAEPIRSLQSLLQKQLSNSTTEDPENVVIKHEPNYDDERNAEYMEMKRRYLSALNISEKLPQPPKKPISMRTRSKSEENKIKSVNGLYKVIGDVSTGIKANHVVAKNPLPKKKDVFIKPTSNNILPKQKARKSFPMPVKNVYCSPVHKKEPNRIVKPLIASTSVASIRSASLLRTNEVYTTSNNFVYITNAPLMTNASAILPPNQPITFTANRVKPIITLVPHQENYLPLPAASSKKSSDTFESQNYIPLNGEVPRPRAASNVRSTTTTAPETTVTTTVTQITSNTNTLSTVSAIANATDVLDGLANLTTSMPSTFSKTVNDIISRATPIKPRPPGPLSDQFEEGVSNAAGRITTAVNLVSNRLGDYFRGMLIELLNDMVSTNNPEFEILKLKLTIEKLQYEHKEEILEIKKNINNVLKDCQKSMEDQVATLLEDARAVWETENAKNVAEAKSKQWCANCSKESQFYCCWNTSYCDFPCQKKHWPSHMAKCTQNSDDSRILQPSNSTPAISTTSTSTITTRPTQSFVIRQAPAPKTFATKALIAKPAKVILNRGNVPKNKIGYVRTNSGTHITLVESTPGNFELIGNGGPISVGGKFISGLGKIRSNTISLPSPSTGPSTSASVVKNIQKTVIHSQAKSVEPITTVISDDDE